MQWNNLACRATAVLDKHAHFPRIFTSLGNSLTFVAMSGNDFDLWTRAVQLDAPNVEPVQYPENALDPIQSETISLQVEGISEQESIEDASASGNEPVYDFQRADFRKSISYDNCAFIVCISSHTIDNTGYQISEKEHR